KKCMEHIAKTMNEKYGDGAVTLVIREQYRNMIEMVKPHIEVVEKAFSAAKKCGLTPTASPIRGGTDGAQLSFRGLPCPNLPTGSYGHHGPYEHAVCEEMDVCVDLIVNIVREYASDVQ
ncbi:MAG: peptidase T, partial [Clostridia bacterium]|nr:peptidase T [Clostridia bacterium]